MKVWSIIICLAVMQLVVMPGHADHADRIAIGVFALKPWGQINDKGDVEGITVDMFEAIAQESGLSFDYKIMPYRRMLRELQKQSIDGSIFFKSPFSAKISNPIAHIHNAQNIVIGLEGTDIKHYDDLLSLKMAVPNGVFYQTDFDTDSRLSKLMTSDHIHSIRMLMHKRVDAIVGPARTLMLNLRLYDGAKHKLGEPYILSVKEVWLHVNDKLDSKTQRRLIEAISRLKDKQTFSQILDDYFGNAS